MNKVNNIPGFTMIELIVVISIVATLLLFSFPVFRSIGPFSDTTSQVGDIVRLVNDLKKRAVEKNQDLVLHIDTDTHMIWVTDDAMDDAAKQTAKDGSAQLSEQIRILDIEFPGKRETSAREYRIRFRKKGYNDLALVHITDGDTAVTLKIEPFLSRVKVLDTHVYLDDCI